MTLQTSTSFIPEKYRILSGSALKVLAMAIMLIDHTASFLLRYYPPVPRAWFQIGSISDSLYRGIWWIIQHDQSSSCLLFKTFFDRARSKGKWFLRIRTDHEYGRGLPDVKTDNRAGKAGFVVNCYFWFSHGAGEITTWSYFELSPYGFYSGKIKSVRRRVSSFGFTREVCRQEFTGSGF